METILSTINLLPSGKRELGIFVHKLKQEILSGYAPVLEVAAKFDLLKKAMDTILKDDEVRSAIEHQANMYSEKTIELRGFSITKTTRTTWHYSHDSEWRELKEKVEAREEIMMQATKQQSIIFDSHGVAITPAIRKTIEYLQFKAK